MPAAFRVSALDVEAFARQQGSLSGRTPVRAYGRLAREARSDEPDLAVEWSVHGEQRRAVDGVLRPALHVRADTCLPLTCQRCMEEVRVPLAVDRHFVFLPDEASAAALDEASEDDLLVLARDFDAQALIEDELLMTLPLVPRHEQCPVPIRLSAQDAEFEAALRARGHPFAVLERLKGDKPH